MDSSWKPIITRMSWYFCSSFSRFTSEKFSSWSAGWVRNVTERVR